MWVELNARLKRSLPRLHRILKRRAAKWQSSPAPGLPVLKFVRGDLFLAHPSVLTLDTHDAEPHICRWILDHLRSGSVFFDVGAHCGWLSLKAAKRVGRKGRVIAFEPSPAMLPVLQYHQRVNFVPQMTVVGKAVSETEGRVTLHLVNGGFSFRNSLTIGQPGLPFLEFAEVVPIGVPALTLDSYCSTTGLEPQVVKIDVEGAELMVVRGAAETLRRCRPILILSMHPYWLPPNQSTAEILEFLAGLGYRVRDLHIVNTAGYEVGDYLLAA